MNILALELSSAVGSIAMTGGPGQSSAFRAQFPNDRKDSGAFFGNLRTCLAQGGAPDRIVVGLGPGSYAGARIAIAAGTGVAVATGAQLCGVASLRALETDAAEYVVIGDARRASYFFARVQDRACVEGPVLLSAEELRERLRREAAPLFAQAALAEFPRATVRHASALILASLGESAESAAPLEPIYLRPPHITVPRSQPTNSFP